MSRGVIIAVCLVGGLLLGWKARPAAAEARPTSPGISSPRANSPRPKWTKEELIKAMGTTLYDRTKNPLAEELADWSTEEIRAALEASLASPDCRMPGNPASGLPHFLMGAWMQRDFTAAREWFESLPSGKDKEKMAAALAMYWPEDKGNQAIDYLLANPEVMERSKTSLLLHGIQSAVNQGPSALIALMTRLRKSGNDYPNVVGGGFPSGIQYPADFDFATLMASDEFALLPPSDASGAISTADALLSKWHTRDREAAYDWLIEHRGVEGFKTLAWNSAVDPTENMRWLTGKADALSAENKEAFRTSILTSWLRSPEKLRQFAEATQDPNLAEAARRYGIQAMFFGATRGALPVIEGIDAETRLRLLETAELDSSLMRYPYRQRLDSDDEALLRKKLTEWNASDEQIMTILSRFK
ncbi:MAG TPA: hypothetical protein VGE67_00710 [Haloferula sp.]